MLSRTAQRASHVARLVSRSLASQSSSSVPTATPLATTPASASAQSPNLSKPWSTSQRRRDDAYSEARFEQTALDFQPQPLSAMEMIHSEPIRIVHGRKAVCDGGVGPLGHPKVFINLDKPGPKACGYVLPLAFPFLFLSPPHPISNCRSSFLWASSLTLYETFLPITVIWQLLVRPNSSQMPVRLTF
ncbi:hypothetical protein SCHPADRAFT_826313 [Schizopora paradoxa]|uniref:Zinc finger CHCC-type domain-containing protein n=1 Tax=Schizopora paradoxa TaxID=27342 RepID=A0A0H2RR85_9AGAM|nr:hypothetical protein SCHPADRAFT_826313 [Schizopora paradoxa]